MKFKIIDDSDEKITEKEFNNGSRIKEPSKADKTFADDFYAFISEFIPDPPIDEQFTSKHNAKIHYQHHCIGGNKNNHKSTRTKVLYDFTDRIKFQQYENGLSNELQSPGCIVISSLLDKKAIYQSMTKFFKTKTCIMFSSLCGFENNNGTVVVGIRSYSQDVTTNYLGGNTLDFIVLQCGAKPKTVTLYPIDFNYFQNKFNNLIKNHSKTSNIFFNWNK